MTRRSARGNAMSILPRAAGELEEGRARLGRTLALLAVLALAGVAGLKAAGAWPPPGAAWWRELWGSVATRQDRGPRDPGSRKTAGLSFLNAPPPPAYAYLPRSAYSPRSADPRRSASLPPSADLPSLAVPPGALLSALAPSALTSTALTSTALAPAGLDPAALRPALLAAINAERRLAGAARLAASSSLDRVAQERAEEMARAGRLPAPEESFRLFAQVQRRIRLAGYHPHGWTESIASTPGEVPEVIAYWKADASYRDAMGADYRDLGVGVAQLGGVPLYLFLFAWPEADFFTRQTAPLADLAEVRRRMLAAVNAVREKNGLPPLDPDARLDRAAQGHAEDMLARSFYSHASPDGISPMVRVLRAGYLSRRVGENIAEGEFTVDEVMDGWMKSAGHRENILDGAFTHVGVGLAVGRFEDRLHLLWVQDFARPADPAAVLGAGSGTR
jgi:uncharacterized protein YkwD